MPWINWLGAKLIQYPVNKHRGLQIDETHKLDRQKMLQSIEMERLQTEQRKTLLRRATVEQEIKDAPLDDDLRDKLKEKPVPLSEMELRVLKIAESGVSRGISFGENNDGYHISVDDEIAESFENKAEYLEAKRAANTLVYKDLLEDGEKGWLKKITNAGIKYLQELKDAS